MKTKSTAAGRRRVALALKPVWRLLTPRPYARKQRKLLDDLKKRLIAAIDPDKKP